MFVFDAGVTLEALVKAITMGRITRRPNFNFEALKNAGAMQAELVVI